MKTLITHINPHLDDIAAIWLFKKYHPDFKDAGVEFISASREAASEASPDQVFVGTGGGQFDEHKEGLKTSAGSLVFEYLKEQGLIPVDPLTKKALEKLMEWNNLVDTGQAPNSEFDAFSVQSFIRSKDNSSESSTKSVELGSEILDRILKVLIKKEQSILDWSKRVEFESKFGKSFAVSSETVDREFCREQEGKLFLMYDPKYPSVQYFGPEVDLEPIYQKVKELDSEASWFLHQSHHMVICGSSSAPDSKPTKLSFEELIDVVTSVW
ncbi:hypothetical protein HYU93_02055 [Candidatus Daviesbacteria bacterium]|nr:hypothetical protein [Candidatus Daviesbacteria bacterium]